MNSKSVLILIIFAFFFACTKKNGKSKEEEPTEVVPNCPDSSNSTLSYSIHIVPIINASCGPNAGACHNASSGNGDFNSYQGFTAHPAAHIISAIKQDGVYTPMPMAAPKLSACNIAKIVNWINQGELNN